MLRSCCWRAWASESWPATGKIGSKKEQRGCGRGALVARVEKLRLANDLDGFLDVVVGLVDMLEGALLQPLGEGVVFFLGDIIVGFVEQFDRAVQAAGPVHAGIDGGGLVDGLPVIDRDF